MKNRNIQKTLLSILFSVTLFSCSKLEIEEDLGVKSETVTMANMGTNLAIINLSVDQNEFDHMMAQYGQDIEISGYFAMYESYPKLIIDSAEVLISIKGSSTAMYPLKSLSIDFDHHIDNTQNTIISPPTLLPNHSLDELSKISLRNSGNDFYESNIKDAVYTQMAINLNLNVELGYYRPVQVFVNNKFYGLLKIRTEKSKSALSKLLGTHKGDMNLLRVNHIGNGNEEIEFKDGDETIMQELVDAANSGNTSKLKSMIDVASFIDYYIFQDFIGNSDWPYNNVQMHSELSNPFRFFLYDLDFAGTRDKYFVEDDAAKGLVYNIYTTLKKDDQINAQFDQKRQELYSNCTPQQFKAITNNIANQLEPEINYNIDKYGVPSSVAEWYLHIESIIDQFELRRTNYKNKYKLK